MSALGQKRTSRLVGGMSALPPKADIGTQSRHVRFVPKADIEHPSSHPVIGGTSTASVRRVWPFSVAVVAALWPVERCSRIRERQSCRAALCREKARRA